MFQRIFGWSDTMSDEDLSPEDAQLVNTLHHFKDQFQEQQLPLTMSQDGLKTISKIYYTDKYKGILWTNDMNRELPIKCSDYPQYSQPNIINVQNEQVVKDAHLYGSEKPVTLCEAFVRKYLSVNKN